MKKLILIGAGGHAKSVADSINKSEYELCGFIDSNKKGMHMGLPILGTGLEDILNCEKYSYFVLLEMLDTVSYGLTELENED